MQFYETLYYQLFAALADATEELEQMNYGCAKSILIRCQQEAEERILQQEAMPLQNEEGGTAQYSRNYFEMSSKTT